jgi:ribonuclease P protein component
VISRHRLRGRRRFAAVRTEGLRAASDGVRVQVASNGLDVARVGLAIVGVRSAVRRNRLRRRLRDAVHPLLGAMAGNDVVVVAGGDAERLPFGGLRDALAIAIGRALQRQRSLAASTADNGSMTPTVDPRR